MVESVKNKPGMECNVCMDQFSYTEGYIPRVLNCGHSFCEDCLSKLDSCESSDFDNDSTKFSIKCPNCSTESGFNESVSEFPTNFSLLELISATDEIETCSTFCENHPNYVEDMFCHTDGEAICLKCNVHGEHQSHDVTELSDFAKKQREVLQTDMVTLGDMVDSFSQMKTELDDQMSQLSGNYILYSDLIAKQFTAIQERLVGVVSAKWQRLSSDFNEMYAKQNNYLKLNKMKITNKIKELSELKQKLEVFLKESDDLKVAKEKDLFRQTEKHLTDAKQIQFITEHSFDVRVGGDLENIAQVVTKALDQWECEVHETKNIVNECFKTIHERNLGRSMEGLFAEDLQTDSKCKGNMWKNIAFLWSVNFDECLGQFFNALN